MSKAFRLSNGVVYETEAELKAYIRGLEIARLTSEACTGGRTEFLGKIATALEEAHVAKAAGAKTEEEVAAEAAAAEKPADEAEKPVEAAGAAE